MSAGEPIGQVERVLAPSGKGLAARGPIHPGPIDSGVLAAEDVADSSVGQGSIGADVDPYVAGLRALAREEAHEAKAHLLRAIARSPADGDRHAYLSSALLASGDLPGATDAIETALALAAHAFVPNVKAGEYWMRLGDPVRAEAHFLRALRAAEPGTRPWSAARALLAEARRRRRTSIPHHALLPSWRPRWGRRTRTESAEAHSVQQGHGGERFA